MLSRGAAALTDAELLALFFRVGGGGLNAIELGRKLIETFGSLKAVSRASLEEFQEIPGIGPAKATELAAAFEIGRRVTKEHYSATRVDNPEAVYELLGQEMSSLATEISLLSSTETIRGNSPLKFFLFRSIFPPDFDLIKERIISIRPTRDAEISRLDSFCKS